MEKKSPKPKLLVLLSRVPYPLDKGDKLRAYHQLKGLHERFEIILCCLYVGNIPNEAREKLEPLSDHLYFIPLSKAGIAWRVATNWWHKRPFQVAFFHSPKAQQELDKIIEKHLPHRFYCQLIRVTEYARKYTIFGKTLDYMDALSIGMQRRYEQSSFLLRPLIREEAKRLATYENQVFQDFEKKVIISEQDRDHIAHHNTDEIDVIPNGIPVDYFEPRKEKQDVELLFTGNMAYPPNIEGAQYIVKKIMPLVWEKYPDTKVLISGKSPTMKVKMLAGKNVLVSGWVEDMRDSYARAKIFVAPMVLGSGLQNKLLEAMAMELPCITSPIANRALGAKENEEILIGTEPEEYAQHIIDLIEQPEKQQKLAESGRKYVSQSFDWNHWNQRLANIIQK
ncbi:glycosyltransferase [bacterium SCSIO 12741]|nr:glycosyltransferase [bacterium SCSIO 12741]